MEAFEQLRLADLEDIEDSPLDVRLSRPALWQTPGLWM